MVTKKIPMTTRLFILLAFGMSRSLLMLYLLIKISPTPTMIWKEKRNSVNNTTKMILKCDLIYLQTTVQEKFDITQSYQGWRT